MTSTRHQDPAPGTVGLDEHGILVDLGTKAMYRRRDALFASNPTCEMCKQVITEREDAYIQSQADGREYLIHGNADCFRESMHRMMARYGSRAKQGAA